MQLPGKVALVTGAAHRVGREVALALAREGANIVVHYGASRAASDDTVAELAAIGVEAFAVAADLAEPAEIEALFEAVGQHFGRLDVLVNSAATFQKRAWESVTAAEWDHVIAVNLRAPFLCSQQAGRLMRTSARAPGETAAIVNLVDLSGVQAWRGYIHHGVSKAGLLHLTAISARELAPDIRVNAVIPGPILPPPGMEPTSEAWRRMGERVPLGHAGDPKDVGAAVVFLARSDFVTGAVLHVDGGEHLLPESGR